MIKITPDGFFFWGLSLSLKNFFWGGGLSPQPPCSYATAPPPPSSLRFNKSIQHVYSLSVVRSEVEIVSQERDALVKKLVEAEMGARSTSDMVLKLKDTVNKLNEVSCAFFWGGEVVGNILLSKL